jgi:2,4-dienoyl-CoA reductase-like NADH-dependent reductase (Old Yellow Enzyme family)
MADSFFRPIRIRNLDLANRLVMSPMSRGMSPDGVPPATAADYYGRRAKSGIGLIVTEGIGIDHPAATGDNGSGSLVADPYPEMHSEAAQREWRSIVDTVHKAGSAIFPQLWHQGALRLDDSGRHPQVRSPRPSGLWGPERGASAFSPEHLARRELITKPVTEEEIADIIAGYAASAASAIALRFDGVALHGGHGYLIDSFFWHHTNHRTDRWGGMSLGARAAFGVEVVRAVRNAIGDAPIMFRFSQWKMQDYDGRLADSPRALEELLIPLAEAGVDMFDASTRRFASPAFPPSGLSLAGWTQKITGRPTMAVGGIGLSKDMQTSLLEGAAVEDNLGQARAMLEREEIALVGIGRGLLANPDWAERVRTGQPLRAYRGEDALTII